MTLMKVMMLTEYPRDSSTIEGGVAAAAHNLVRALVRYTDAHLTVLTYSGTGGPRLETDHGGRLVVRRFNAPGRFGHALDFAAQRREFATALAADQPDLVHAQGEGLYASLAVRSGKPNVYTIHGVRLKELAMSRSRIGMLRHYLRARLIRDHHRAASGIIAINAYTRRAINGLHNADVWTIHNAVDEVYFDLHAESDVRPGEVLLVGGLRPRKDVATAIRAIDRVASSGSRIMLHVVGPDESGYAEQIRQLVRARGVERHVELHGLVDEARLRELYCRADVVLLSSVEESSPISIVQGMAAGKPIVATDVGGIREMVEEGANGYLSAAGDDSTLANNLSRVIGDRALRDAFARCSRERALSQWSAQATAQQTYGVYEELISRQPRQRLSVAAVQATG
jgi:glycosyltransferase involved in cell wall biosynthesis